MFRSDLILALDIGASSLKMGQFAPTKSGGLELLQYAVRELDPDSSDETARLLEIREALQDILSEKQWRPGPVMLSVMGQAVFSRFVKLPPVGREKVLQIVQYEAQQNVPFPINEVVWDYQLIGSRQGELDVMLAAIKSDIIEKLADTVSEVGLTPDLVDVAPMALYNCVRFNYHELPACTLLIDIGARSTDLVFIEQDRVFNRSIPVGGQTITQQIMKEFNLSQADAEDLKKQHAFVSFGGAFEAPPSEVADKVSKSVRSIMTRLHAEITRSINFYRTQQSGGMPQLALLTGGGSIIPYTDTFLKEKLKIEVDYLNPFLNVTVSPAIDANEIGNQAHLLGEVVGLALRRAHDCPIELNLLPAKIVNSKIFRRRQPFFVAAMIAGLLVLLVWCFFFAQLGGLGRKRLGRTKERVAALEQVEGRLRNQEQQLADATKRLEWIGQTAARRTRWLQVLDALRERLPEGMWLTGARVDAPAAPVAGPDAGPQDAPAAAPTAPALEITGLGYIDKVGRDGAIKLRDALRQSPLVREETEITYSPPAGGSDYLVEFKIRVLFREPVAL